MPYSSTSELPEPVRSKYSEKCQRAFMHAFNSVYEDTGDDGRASAAGHSAAQDCEGKKTMGDINIGQRFEIFAKTWDPTTRDFYPTQLKTSTGPDGRMRLHGVASSTVKDLHGDTMLASALEDMERDGNNNLTIFGNHEYKVPEDVYGSVEKAVLKAAGTVDKAGDPIYDLMFDVVINDENERAVKTWKAIDRGTKLGMSIGAMIPEGGATRDKKSGAFTIAHVELLETSIVGIPANPRSWVDYAVKSLLERKKTATTVPLGAPELTLDTDAGTYNISGSLADIGLISVRQKDGTTAGFEESDLPEDAVLIARHAECGEMIEGFFPEGICTKCGGTGPFESEWVMEDILRSTAVVTTIETTAVPEIADAATCPDCGRSDDGKGCQNPYHRKTAGACPDCGQSAKSGGECHNPYHSKADSVEPEVTDAKVTIIEVDTGDSGSSESEPVSEPEAIGDESEGVTAAAADTIDAVKSLAGSLDGPIAGTIQSLLDLTNGLLVELTESKARESEALAAKAAAEQERDSVVRTAGDLINQTNALIQRLGDLRVGPKTLVKEASDELDDLRGIYTESFLDMLKEGSIR